MKIFLHYSNHITNSSNSCMTPSIIGLKKGKNILDAFSKLGFDFSASPVLEQFGKDIQNLFKRNKVQETKEYEYYELNTQTGHVCCENDGPLEAFLRRFIHYDESEKPYCISEDDEPLSLIEDDLVLIHLKKWAVREYEAPVSRYSYSGSNFSNLVILAKRKNKTLEQIISQLGIDFNRSKYTKELFLRFKSLLLEDPVDDLLLKNLILENKIPIDSNIEENYEILIYNQAVGAQCGHVSDHAEAIMKKLIFPDIPDNEDYNENINLPKPKPLIGTDLLLLHTHRK